MLLLCNLPLYLNKWKAIVKKVLLFSFVTRRHLVVKLENARMETIMVILKKVPIMAETVSLEEIHLLIFNSKNQYHVFFDIIDLLCSFTFHLILETTFVFPECFAIYCSDFTVLRDTFNFPDNIIDFSKGVLYIRVKCVSFKCYTVLRLLSSPQVKDILKPEVMEEIVMLTQQKLLEQKGWRAVLTVTLLQNQDPTSLDTHRPLLIFLNPFIFMCAAQTYLYAINVFPGLLNVALNTTLVKYFPVWKDLTRLKWMFNSTRPGGSALVKLIQLRCTQTHHPAGIRHKQNHFLKRSVVDQTGACMSPGCSRLLAVLAHARRWRQTWPHPHISVNHLASGSMAAPATPAALGQSCSFSRGQRWMSSRVEGSVQKSWAATNERNHLREASSGCGRLSVLDLSPPPRLKCL